MQITRKFNQDAAMEHLIDKLAVKDHDPRVSRRHLSYFYAAAKVQNFTKAAKLCGVAQPSLSRGISLLEEAMKTKLFDRVGRSVKLTPKGEEVFPVVELLLNQFDDISRSFAGSLVNPLANLRISAVTSLTSNFLPRLVNSFEQENPEMQVTIFDGLDSDVYREVDVGDTDIGITTQVRRPDHFRIRELFQDQLAVVVAEGHSLANRTSVELLELDQLPIASFAKATETHQELATAFHSVGLYYKPAATVRYRSTLMGLVLHRGLATLLPRIVAEEHGDSRLRIIPLVKPVLRRSYYTVMRKNGNFKPGVMVLEEFLRQSALNAILQTDDTSPK